MNQPIQVMEWQRQYTVWRFLLYGVVAKKKGSWLKKDWASQKKEKGASFKPCDDRLWKMFKTLLDLTWNKIMFPSLIFLFNSTPLECLFTGWLKTYVLSFYFFIKEERKFDLLKSQKTILSSRWELNTWPGCSINHWATGALWWAVSNPLMSLFWCILNVFVVSFMEFL